MEITDIRAFLTYYIYSEISGDNYIFRIYLILLFSFYLDYTAFSFSLIIKLQRHYWVRLSSHKALDNSFSTSLQLLLTSSFVAVF